MINFERIYQRFNEAKQVGIIYHITDYEGFKGIIESDTFGALEPTTSFTRNKRFTYVPGSHKDTFVQFTVDGNKLSEKYHIEPHADRFHYRDYETELVRWEAEERLYGRAVNAGKYITKMKLFDEPYPAEKYLLYKYLEKYPHIETNIDFSDFIDLNNIDIDGIYKNGKLVKSLHGNFDLTDDIIEFFNLRDSFDEKDLQDLANDGPIYDTLTSEMINGYDFVWTDPTQCRIYVRTENIENYDYLKEYNSDIVEMPYKLQFENY